MIPLHDDNPTSLTPVVTVTLIVMCTIVFLWQLSLGPAGLQGAVMALGVVPVTLLGDAILPAEISMVPPTVTLITSQFLHGGWMHLIGNMLYLWIFGNNVEDSMGHGRFIVFYLLCGVLAGMAHAIPNPTSAIPTIGASGAISGVLGAYLLLFPHARVMVFVPFGLLSRVLYLPAGWVLGFWFIFQLLSASAVSSETGGVAWGAHVGGFVAGMALIPLFKYKHVRLFHPMRRHY